MLLCVDAPFDIRQSIVSAAEAGNIDATNPYSWPRQIIWDTLELYDKSFWGLRDVVRNNIEKKVRVKCYPTLTSMLELSDAARYHHCHQLPYAP